MKYNKPLTVKSKQLITLVLTIILAIVCIITYDKALKDVQQLVVVPVAKKTLHSRVVIHEDDIEFIEVPKNIVLDNVILEKEQLIGLYVKPYHAISKQSLFYKELIVDEKTMNDATLFSLDENEIAISIDADVKSSYANSILVGHMIDLYYLGKVKEGNSQKDLVMVGELVKNARVIAVKDKEGQSIEGDLSLKTEVIVVALKQEDAHLVEIAKSLGKVSPMISYDNLNQKSLSQYYDSTKIKNILLGNSLDVTIVKHGDVNG